MNRMFDLLTSLAIDCLAPAGQGGVSREILLKSYMAKPTAMVKPTATCISCAWYCSHD